MQFAPLAGKATGTVTPSARVYLSGLSGQCSRPVGYLVTPSSVTAWQDAISAAKTNVFINFYLLIIITSWKCWKE